jgi:hypothetical protein
MLASARAAGITSSFFMAKASREVSIRGKKERPR